MNEVSWELEDEWVGVIDCWLIGGVSAEERASAEQFVIERKSKWGMKIRVKKWERENGWVWKSDWVTNSERGRVKGVKLASEWGRLSQWGRESNKEEWMRKNG